METSKARQGRDLTGEFRALGRGGELLFLVVLTAVAMAMRICLFPIESGDYQQFLKGWYDTMDQNGGLLAAGMDVGDYMPPYFYVLGVLSYLPLSPLNAIKLASCVADMGLAFVVLRLVENQGGSRFQGVLAYGAVLFLPSVFLNSAAWAQCDAIFVSALLASLLCLMQNRSTAAVVWFSISFVFKLQAIFFAPFLLLLLLKGRVRWKSLLAFPLVYLIAILPAAILGRNFFSLLTVYFRQAGQYNLLSMYLPNLWTWVFGSTSPELGKAGVFFAGGVILASLFCLMRRRFALTPQVLSALALFYALLVPYMLPYMHERYFYLADLLSVVYVFAFPRKWYVSVVLCLASANAVCHNLFGTEFLPIQVWSLAVLAVLLLLAKHVTELTKDRELAAGEAGQCE